MDKVPLQDPRTVLVFFREESPQVGAVSYERGTLVGAGCRSGVWWNSTR